VLREELRVVPRAIVQRAIEITGALNRGPLVEPQAVDLHDARIAFPREDRQRHARRALE
jgi:hypothetical protein